MTKRFSTVVLAVASMLAVLALVPIPCYAASAG